MHVVTADSAAAVCPSCGNVSTSLKQNAVTRPKDLPYGPAAVKLIWHKRRWRCRETDCPQQTFTEQVPAVPPRARTTARLRQAVADAVGDNRCAAEVARSHRLSWPTVQRAVNAAWAQVLGEPATTRLLGIDETRFGRPRWRQADDGRWQLVEPWETGFVDLTGAQGCWGRSTGVPARRWPAGWPPVRGQGVARCRAGGRDRPVGAVRGRGTTTAAARPYRGGSLPSGAGR